MDNLKDKIKPKNGILPEKVFVERNSLLTELLKTQHIQSLYNICVSILICLLINSMANEYVTKGQVTIGLNIIIGAFSNFHEALLIWIFMFTLVLFGYIGMAAWAKITMNISPKSQTMKTWNKISLVALITYYLSIIVIPTTLIRVLDQPIASSLALLMEQTRFIMKIHAFVRSNVPEILNFKTHSEKKSPMPSFGHFIFFLFVPTLVYKNEYPRSKTVNWKYVISCFFEVILVIFYMAFIVEKFFMQPFQDFCLKETEWSSVGVQILSNSVPGLLILLCSFYLFLHSWLNGFSEMLRFGDRLFYKDWWNSNTYARYFKTWNVVVHDWLFTYIYKDVYEILAPKNQLMAKYSVFFVSALFHEYIISFALKMFLPIMFVQFFFIGTLFTLVKDFNYIGNIFLWYSIELGQSIMMSMYAIELYSRYNCPVENVTFSSYFVPRFLTCNCLQ